MNYEKKVMENVYSILSKEDFDWSYEFKDSMKVQLLNLLLDYFTDIEQYEKCSNLQKMLVNLENTNESNSETVVSGSSNY